jgi:hypothetical protein
MAFLILIIFPYANAAGPGSELPILESQGLTLSFRPLCSEWGGFATSFCWILSAPETDPYSVPSTVTVGKVFSRRELNRYFGPDHLLTLQGKQLVVAALINGLAALTPQGLAPQLHMPIYTLQQSMKFMGKALVFTILQIFIIRWWLFSETAATWAKILPDHVQDFYGFTASLSFITLLFLASNRKTWFCNRKTLQTALSDLLARAQQLQLGLSQEKVSVEDLLALTTLEDFTG